MAGCAAAPLLSCRSLIARDGAPTFTPVRLPHPLRAYTTRESFLAVSAPDAGSPASNAPSGVRVPASSKPFLARYEILDDVIVPPEYDRYVICMWGERPFTDVHHYVGYNHDYTGFVPLARDGRVSTRGGDGASSDGLLCINHESISFPFHKLAPKAPPEVRAAGVRESFPEVIGFALPHDRGREVLGEMHYNMGGSILRVKRGADDGRFRVVAKDPLNRRLHGLSGLALNRVRTDAYSKVTSWGRRPHQQGDENYLVGTGPAARDVFADVNADGLGLRIIGTAFNCSGATTPWGTILSAEENFQHTLHRDGFLGVTEKVGRNGSQTRYRTGTSGAEFGLVGEKYGWIVEIDPRRPRSRAKKHTALGRFRHENVALRVEAGKPLIAYSGDDRRGGHVYKYVSSAAVTDPSSPRNSRLLEGGLLYVARMDPGGSGKWIPLSPTTPTNPNSPSEITAGERTRRADGKADPSAHVRLPRRAELAGEEVDGGAFVVTMENESAVLDDYRGKHLQDFYDSAGAILCDAFLASNLVGGTPGARPEDIEVHPVSKDVFVAFTSGDARDDEGYADSRIFTVGKYSASASAEQSHGGLYKIIEDSGDGAGSTFRWERVLQSGEAGAERGGGFANVDNLLFDASANLWCATDTASGRQNIGAAALPAGVKDIRHDTALWGKDARELAGVFGDNWMFVVPAGGTGELLPFCYGPPGCEFTGPTMVGDTLIVSIQHPGEDALINDGSKECIIEVDVEMLDLDGRIVVQRRIVPRGSNWPSNILDEPLGPPRPSTIGIAPRRSLTRS